MALQTVDQLVAMFKATGGPEIRLGQDTTYGHFDIADDVAISESEVLIGAPTVLIATGTRPDLALGTTILVGAESYVVRDPRRIEDGMLTRIELSEA